MISFKCEPDVKGRFYILALDKGVEVGFAHALYIPNTQTLVLLESEIKEQYRGQGLGTQLYLEVVKEVKLENKGKSLTFIPDYLHGGKTNQSALRLWDSLARRFKSSSHKIYIP